MSLSIVENQDVLDFANNNKDELEQLIGPAIEQVHQEDGFMEIPLLASLLISLVISLGNLSKSALSISELLRRAIALLRW